MWVYVVMKFSKRTKLGRERQKLFCREIAKDGFRRLYDSLYVRYCSSIGNAQMHKKRIMEKIMEKCQISIMFVDDRHNGQSYHFLGGARKEKMRRIYLKCLIWLNFFNPKFLVIYWKSEGCELKV